MNNQTSIFTKAAAWVGLLLALATGLVVMTSGSNQSPNAGSINSATVNNNPWAFLTGIYLGNQKIRTTADMITITPGTNQATWKNTSGVNANVFNLDAYLVSGTASSTEYISVGTTTCATVTDNFSVSAAPMWSQAIDAFKYSTSSQGVVADLTGHKTNYPGSIQVASGECLAVVIESFCKADGACNTATSSARGWSTMNIPFDYTAP